MSERDVARVSRWGLARGFNEAVNHARAVPRGCLKRSLEV
jgi:hypothetical protein